MDFFSELCKAPTKSPDLLEKGKVFRKTKPISTKKAEMLDGLAGNIIPEIPTTSYKSRVTSYVNAQPLRLKKQPEPSSRDKWMKRQRRAKHKSSSSGKRALSALAARQALAERFQTKNLVEWIRKDRSGAFCTKLDELWTKFTNKEVEGRDLRRLATAALTH